MEPIDLLNWQKRLRELSGDVEEWADPALSDMEDKILSEASASASEWLLNLWLISKRALKNRTKSTFDDVIKESEPDPVSIERVVRHIQRAQEIGIKRVEHSKELPDKGPWIEVPTRPSGLIKLTPPKSKAAAEWIARQSAGAKMREWASGMREDVRWQVVQAIREDLRPAELAKRLNERWDDYGQHFQTIAVTEMSMAYNDAVLSHLGDDYVVVPPIGDEKVCKHCFRLLEGKVFWVSPVPIQNATQQENEQYMWVGKSNVGRKVKDWIPCIPLHPNCRHVFLRYRGGDPYEYRVKQRHREEG